MQLQDHLTDYRDEYAKILTIHCEGSPRGTRILADRMGFGFPLFGLDKCLRTGTSAGAVSRSAQKHACLDALRRWCMPGR